MKKKIEYPIFKALLLVAVLFCTSLVASAQSKLTVDAQKFVNHDVVNVPINFSKANPIVGMNFTVKLPDFLEFAGNPIRNDDRFYSSQTTISFKNGNVVIAGFSQKEILGDEGLLLSIPVKVKDSVTVPSSGNIRISNITFAGAGTGSLTQPAPSWTQESFSVKAEYLPYEIAFSTDATKIVANAGATISLPVNITNNCDILGFQAQIKAPAGIKWNDAAVLSNRCPNDGVMTVTEVSEGVVNLVYISMSNTPLTGNSGLAFTLDGTVVQDFAPANGEITLDNVQVSYTSSAWVPAKGFKLLLVNGTTAYNNLNALVDGLRTQLTNALNEIAQTCPDVKDNFTGEAISQAIEALANEIETLYANGGLNDAESRLTETAENIGNDITKLIEDAKNAQRNHANTGAYNAVIDQINTLQELLNTISTTVAEQYPGIDVEAEKTAAQNAINKAKADAKAALDAVAAEGQFNYTVPTEEITNLINAIPTAAETKRVAANTVAYNNVKAEIAALQKKLDDVVTSVATNYPGINVDTEKTAAQNAINTAKADAEAAFTAVAASGFYTYKVPAENINALITAILTAADSKRVAANTAAYNESLALIDQLQQKLYAENARVASEYPGINVEAEKKAAQDAINTAKSAAEAAFKAVTLTGFYSYQVPVDDITALINAIGKTAETKRQNGNKEAYDSAVASVAELQKKLDETSANVAANYPGIDVTAEKKAAQDAIDKAKADIEAAKKAAEEKGAFSYTVPVAEITSLIDAVKTAAEAKRVEANKTAHAAVIAEIAALQKKFDDMEKTLLKDYPGIDMDSEIEAADKAISDAKTAADAALAAVAQTGFFSYNVPSEDIEKLINALPVTANEKRMEANEKAYNETLAIIADLQAELNDMKAEVAQKYPDADAKIVADAIKKAQDAIDAESAAAKKAYDDVAEKGNYSYEVNEDAIKLLIADIMTQAGTAGIYSICIDELPSDIKIFDLQGHQLKQPKLGEVNIVVHKNGKVSKVIVK